MEHLSENGLKSTHNMWDGLEVMTSTICKSSQERKGRLARRVEARYMDYCVHVVFLTAVIFFSSGQAAKISSK